VAVINIKVYLIIQYYVIHSAVKLFSFDGFKVLGEIMAVWVV
jgi:hypothetical protein